MSKIYLATKRNAAKLFAKEKQISFREAWAVVKANKGKSNDKPRHV